MADDDPDNQKPLDAGDFASWIGDIGRAIRDEGGSKVPCAGCTACCRSRQFVHVGPDEPDTIAHIPRELLFPAPRMPEGHLVLGYDQQGHCPMLVDGRCSIYEHRPKACRAYDCRVFPATGIPVRLGQEAIARRAQRWQFSFGSDADLAERDACRLAARFLDDHRGLWPEAGSDPTRLATAALAIHDLFMAADDGSGQTPPGRPDPQQVRAELGRRLGRAGSSAESNPAAGNRATPD